MSSPEGPAAALALLEAYGRGSLGPEELSALAETLGLIREHPDCLLRTCLPGHLTGSAWIVSHDRTHVLLTLHRKLGRWLQLGGHADGQADLLQVALREAHEESGLSRVTPLAPGIYDIDRHFIPARKDEPGHWHHDLRFLFEADMAEPLVISSESRQLAWVPLGRVASLNSEESMARLVRKSPRGR